MPPKQAHRRITQSQSQNEAVFELGVAGRKTGLTIEERQRDEHGFEDVSGLFSSPEKDINNATANGINGARGRNHAESDEEQTMEIDDESQMGPATTMKQRQSRPSLPRARSPIKTNLKSPARQNPHLVPTSSPTRGSVVTAREPNPPKSVNRKLNFSQSSSQNRVKPAVNGHSKVNGIKGRSGKLTNGRAHSSDSEEDDAILQGRRRHPQEEEAEEEEPEESMQVIDVGGEELDYGEDQQDDLSEEPEAEVEVEVEEEPIQEPEPVQQPKRRGRKPKAPVVVEEEREPSIVEEEPSQHEEVEDEPPRKKQRGRPAKNSSPKEESKPPTKSTKRRRSGRSSGGSASEEQEQEQEQEDNVEQERETKRQRSEKKETKASSSKPTATKDKGKPGRKRKSSGIGVDEPVVQRGPPLPKGRGLVALRREEEEDNMRTTRSGRLSYRPLQFWKGEQVLHDSSTQDVFEDKGQYFVMPKVRGVVRTADDTPPRRRRPGRPSKQRGRAVRHSVIMEEEEERDDWEQDPGRIVGECVYWNPDQETQEDDGEVEVVEEELAISEAAIQLKDIRDATFRFAKTLTTPFFGSGIVDMPPGSEKRTKNSRKMQMVFFVHTGSVEVKVAQTEFRIAKGGMWFVPRGNHYSITNNSDRPSRIFFAQGCEMVAQPEVQEETQE
ncbi:Mif2/CENP-C like-domain-containing protein [Hypoxylon sp. NC0597]|nr:Mif2/CENP-C like-domain-containing protein [Hypoxylon sp. NC0597]